ncbi:MAG: electron transfer flavoprotein subunit beta/FixA family protein [Alphaproteobacteria bacterium]|nr:electron transfer flavoprotein subunit beta/FixA family protein [Alphaproteobacteria bacterium]
MRILVAVKRVPDPNQRVRVHADGSAVETAGLRWVLNPYDETALECAVRWKESGLATEVLVVAAGGSGCKDILRNALALGADRALHLAASDEVAPLAAARAIADVARSEKCDVALVGSQAVDDGAALGPLVGGLLDWPQATRAVSASVAGGTVRVERFGDSGVEALDLDLPCIVTADLRLAAPRFASLTAVLAAKKKVIEERPVTAAGDAARVLSVAAVSRARDARRVSSARELLAALRERGGL